MRCNVASTGGKVVIFTGLFISKNKDQQRSYGVVPIEDEDALAAVMAHEIAHAIAREPAYCPRLFTNKLL